MPKIGDYYVHKPRVHVYKIIDITTSYRNKPFYHLRGVSPKSRGFGTEEIQIDFQKLTEKQTLQYFSVSEIAKWRIKNAI